MLTNFKPAVYLVVAAVSILVCQSFCCVNNCTAAEESLQEYRYSKPVVNTEFIEQEADSYFYQGIDNQDRTTKEAYLMKALEKYMLLLDYNMYDVTSCTQVAIINDNLGNDKTALEYFKRAVNLENLNPFANFYFAEYYFSRRDYNNALKYYLVAYENGFDNHYQVSLKIATIYEKFGDFKNAKKFYIISQKQNPELRSGVINKLKSINNVYYSKSDYR